MLEKKNAVYYFQISLFVPEVLKFLKYANLPSYDVIYSTNQAGGDWKRVSCHGQKMFYSLGCVFYRTISLPNFNDLRCKLAKIALFTQTM